MPRFTTKLGLQEKKIRWHPITVVSSILCILMSILMVVLLIMNQSDDAPMIHGNVNSKVYHLPGCYWYNCLNCTALFYTAREAEEAGYRLHGAQIRQSIGESR